MATYKFRIPEQFESGFEEILKLSDEETEKLASVLDVVPTTYNTERLFNELTGQIDILSLKERREILTVIFSLYGLRYQQSVTIDELLEGICNALESTEKKNLFVLPENRNVVKEKFKKLLSGKTFDVAGKAVLLAYAQNRALQGASVISDIRSIFGENPEDRPVAAMIIHRLELSVLQAGDPKDIYVALDENDLDKLIEVLNRAKKKNDSLKSLLEASQTPHLSA
jgi:hypothetical protein